jgi:hypothetical protein
MAMAQGCITAPASAYTMSGEPAGGSYSASSAASHSGRTGAYPAADTHFDTRGYTADSAESKALTSYLTQHKLPLVGAQVLDAPDGQRIVVLYGFVGSEFGKSDAVTKAHRYLHDKSVVVENRINVRPELLAANRPKNAPSSASAYDESRTGAPAYPGPEAYAEQNPPGVNQYQQYQNQGLAVSSMLPLIALLGVLGMGLAGGGSGFSFGGSAPPYGYSPYGPYGGGAYPGYPMASPFGASPSGSLPPGVPYRTAPFGAPYGSSPSFP